MKVLISSFEVRLAVKYLSFKTLLELCGYFNLDDIRQHRIVMALTYLHLAESSKLTLCYVRLTTVSFSWTSKLVAYGHHLDIAVTLLKNQCMIFQAGFSCVSCESDMCYLFIANFIINYCDKPNAYRFYPW